MHRFSSPGEAQSFIAQEVDRPVSPGSQTIKPGVTLSTFPIDMGEGRFTNSYDISFDARDNPLDIVAFDSLTSVPDFLVSPEAQQYSVASGGGFFFLADRASASPRQLALNLSISRGSLRSLPVADRESVISGHAGLEARTLVALGALVLNGHALDWSGSLTDYDTEVKVYGNGNAVISHQENPITGSERVLNETSRYTPPISHDDYMDVGFIGRGGNDFIGVGGSSAGGVDIFAHDFVIRCPQRYLKGNSSLQIDTVGGIALSRLEGGAFSAGPSLNIADFINHPVNHDASLGSHPPFIETFLARTALYKTEDNLTHIRLFDGRPGSPLFPGVTPNEAVAHILSEGEFEWGCFLDPGQTAKLGVNYEGRLASYGSRHYMRWPNTTDPNYLWVPDIGRPVANVLAL
ncbi:MAG: hypothetical protein ABI602_02015 [Candidatus Saccharibacteria bacterium]